MAIKELRFRCSSEGDEDEEIFMRESLFLLRDLRQEVTVLAQLSHPNIVALLGVSIRPMCIVLEFAPMGSLFDILDGRVEEMRKNQVDLISTVLRMPGGVLGHVLSAKVAIQV